MKNVILILAVIATAISFVYAPLFGMFLGAMVGVGLIIDSIEKKK